MYLQRGLHDHRLWLPISSQVPADFRIFEPTSDDRRKVIVAINVVET